MMAKRILAFLCALLLLVSGTLSAFAVIEVENDNGEIISSSNKAPTKLDKVKKAVKEWCSERLEDLRSLWQKHGVLTIIILFILAVLGTVVILTVEDEKKKQQAIEKRPKKNHPKN